MNRLVWTFLLVTAALCAACGGSTPPPPESPVTGSPSPPSAAQPELSVKIIPPGASDPGLDRVHEATLDFYAGDLTKLHDRFSPELAKSLTLEQLVALHRRVAEEYGKEIAVLGEDRQSKAEYRGYVRWAKFDKFSGPIEVQWILKPDDTIAGFFIRPAKAQKPQ